MMLDILYVVGRDSCVKNTVGGTARKSKKHTLERMIIAHARSFSNRRIRRALL